MDLKQIADAIRDSHPTATSVTVFVNYHEVTVEVGYRKPEKGVTSIRRLNGDWVKDGDA